MANKSVFKSGQKGVTAPATNTTNRAGGRAYLLGEKAALAQYAATGTFNDTFYSTAEAQVSEVLDIAEKVDPEFIGKVAIYARTEGRMKDMPALLCAHLSTRGLAGLEVLKRVFPLVIDNGKMLRNFVQIMRSGTTGRKSLGTAPKNLVAAWFASKRPEDIFKMSTGNDPSIADVLYLSRAPDLGSPERKAFYAYLLDREHDFDSLPPLVKEYELLKKAPAEAQSLPRVPFEMLMGLPLEDSGWRLLAEQLSWTQLRMNLNTLARHNVFKSDRHVTMVATKLADQTLIEKAKPFPYQLLTTYLNTIPDSEYSSLVAGSWYAASTDKKDVEVPKKILNALHTALEIATKNVPTIEGPVYVAVDVSGSMQSPVTGTRAGATTKTRCVDVAALIGATFLRKNPDGSELLPFSDDLFRKHGCIAQDSIMTNAQKLAKLGGGGTNMTSAIRYLNDTKKKGNLIIIVSDCETWMDDSRFATGMGYYGNGTSVAQAFAEYKSRNPKAKLVTINLAAGQTTQVPSNKDVLNIGGFSDSIWEVIKNFVEGVPSGDYWVDVIDKIQLPMLPAKA
jgi:60 kDa SS-A/Ro ribonucleoprotein